PARLRRPRMGAALQPARLHRRPRALRAERDRGPEDAVTAAARTISSTVAFAGTLGVPIRSRSMHLIIPVAAGLAALASLAAPAVSAEAPVQNPLLAPWTGPHGGLPPFDRVKVGDFKPALEAAMAEQLAEIDA